MPGFLANWCATPWSRETWTRRWSCLPATPGGVNRSRGTRSTSKAMSSGRIRCSPTRLRQCRREFAVSGTTCPMRVEGAEVGAYRALTCRQRDSANAALFWRATPAFARGGNDVRTEWYARRTLIRSLDQAMTHHGMRNSPDYNEMILRYGASTSFARRPDDRSRVTSSTRSTWWDWSRSRPTHSLASPRKANGHPTWKSRAPASRRCSRSTWSPFATFSSRAFAATIRLSFWWDSPRSADTLFVHDSVGRPY